MIDISTENRLKEIAGNLKQDVKDLLAESANVVTKFFKGGLCTSNGLKKCWNTFTEGFSNIAQALNDPDLFAPVIPATQEPIVTVKESPYEELPVGTQLTLSEAEELVKRMNRERWDSDERPETIRVVIDYRMDNVQDRYSLPVQIGPGIQSMLEQMKYHVDLSLKNPDVTCRDFYTAAPGLDALLHEYFGPRFNEELENIQNRILGYFQQHSTISKLEQQFQTQAETLPLKEQKRFLKSAKKAITTLRHAANTGQELTSLQHEPQEQTGSAIPNRQPAKEGHQEPRQSVRVKIQKIKEGQSDKSDPHRASPRRSRKEPQR